MARIPRSVIDAYTRELNAISDENRRGLEDALGRVDWDAPVAVVREQLIVAMQMWCGGATDQAAMLASVFYDGVREIAVGEPMGAFAESHREPDRTTRAVRAFVQDLVDGKGPESVRRKCLERLDYEVKRAAAECVDANARRDRKRPRYARVPSGSETCDFCIMLASRGPVYHSERSAGAVDHFHANCDCRVVPMWDTYYVGPSRRATASSPVEGYDPDELYERYVQAATPSFRRRVAKTGGGSGKETSHPMIWADAKKRGLVTLGSVGEVTDYIRAATSYENLFERIDLVASEWERYALSEKYRLEVQQVMRNTRDRLLGVKGNYEPRTIRVGKSVGAKALNDYIVNMPGGEDSRFFPESDIDEKKVFAGKGSEPHVDLRARFRLSDSIGDDPENWSHVAGEGWVFDPIDGRIRRAEVHWMESPQEGIHEIWWKRWIS